ncbi:MAG: MBL fold metallo-hydrolase [Clostridiales bacterium]|nr:MBL fold metallo-hydrolase [Clostridiales bacterium]MBQ5966488.1 MBL fold metallo-hydrolase [Clostridiales bacterium]
MLISHNGDYQFFNIGGKTYSCYCITYKDKAVMIDCGPLAERETIEKNMQKDFLFDVDAIFLTHAHGDTAGNAEYFSMLYNCPVYCMKESMEALKKGSYTRPGKNHPYIKKAGVAGNIVPKLPAFMPFEPCRNLEVLTKKIAEEYLGKDVMLLMTPGHSEDSISLKIGDTAFIGDAAQFNKRVLAPVFVDNEAQLGRTWQTLLSLSCKQYLSAHGRAFSSEEWLDPEKK